MPTAKVNSPIMMTASRPEKKQIVWKKKVCIFIGTNKVVKLYCAHPVEDDE